MLTNLNGARNVLGVASLKKSQEIFETSRRKARADAAKCYGIRTWMEMGMEMEMVNVGVWVWGCKSMETAYNLPHLYLRAKAAAAKPWLVMNVHVTDVEV